ncbi:MAG: hypothetical protein GY698_07280 [Actinomycetia bacterium]|nr:hypothetical protein [Actinomycetes bacterium]
MELTAQELLALLPVAAASAIAARVFVGVRTIGVFAPALLAIAVLELGIMRATSVLLVAMVAGLAASPLIERSKLARPARLGLILLAITATLVGSGMLDEGDSALPLVVLVSVVERTWETHRIDGPRAGARILATTLAVALLVALGLSATRDGLTGLHWLEVTAVGAAALVAVGRYRGLRLSELRRFDTLLGSDRTAPVEPVADGVVGAALHLAPAGGASFGILNELEAKTLAAGLVNVGDAR